MADFLCFHRVAAAQRVPALRRPIVAPTPEYVVAAPGCERFVRVTFASGTTVSESDFHHTRVTQVREGEAGRNERDPRHAVTWVSRSLSAFSDTDPPCSPRGKWSLEATKVGPGGLDRAGATDKANKRIP
ncbi:hypothetical protein GCM10010129_14720 [Streptomyces fumigatiscleroticus]|nr:hypothetical protein GCM10010129_14720 [Streptomyces fumigatiscleroticus]